MSSPSPISLLLAGVLFLSAASFSHAQNMLSNGGFESYSPPWNDANGASGFSDLQANYVVNLTGWSDASILGSWGSSFGGDPFLHNGPIQYKAASGSFGVGLYFAGSGSLREGIQQTVAVTPGLGLTFSIDLSNGFLHDGSYFAQSSNATISIEIVQGGSSVAATTFSTGTAAAGTYTTHSFSFTPTASSIAVVIRDIGGAGGSGGAQEIWIDNASLTVIPEPSSVALIGGAAALMTLVARRRRSS